MEIRLDDFERVTLRFAVFEVFTELSCNFSPDEMACLRNLYGRLAFEEDNNE
jgi:hypothetical protein